MSEEVFNLSNVDTFMLNEAKTNTLSLLENKFGHDRVFSSSCCEQFSESLYKSIFKILNATIFGNRLNLIDTKLCTQRIFHDVIKHLQGYDDDLKYYASYVPQFNTLKTKIIRESIFMINDNGPMTFMFIVSSICHEMIHQYDAHHEDIKRAMAFNKYHKGLEHTTQCFATFSSLAKMQGINIMVSGKNIPFDILNAQMVQFTLNLQEDNINEDDGKLHGAAYYVDRIRRGDRQGIENMGIMPNGNLAVILA